MPSVTIFLQGEGIRGRLATMLVGALALACLVTLTAITVEQAEAGPRGTYISHAKGRIVPIPRDVAHQDGSYIDRRLIGQLRYIDKRFGPIYITEGYAGPLRGRGTIGCPDCHVTNSDHFTALALDIAAPSGSTTLRPQLAADQRARQVGRAAPEHRPPPVPLGRLQRRRGTRLRPPPAPVLELRPDPLLPRRQLGRALQASATWSSAAASSPCALGRHRGARSATTRIEPSGGVGPG